MDRISLDRTSLDVPSPSIGRQQSSAPVPFTTFHDPRSSSTQSLVPSPSEQDDPSRRKLLVIYIHGFMGNDTSFQSFPAHVHRYLKIALSDTHVIHSKIYPRYKTYKALDVARDNFSLWLKPHESPTTDVVLVGHSMGGLLAADVALMPSKNQYRTGYFLHRILGTVGLDAPFLGLHPSVITAGLASIFRPKSDTANIPEEQIPEDESAQSLSHVHSANTSIYSDPSTASQLSSPHPQSPGVPGSYGITFDPNFNPSFVNDVRVQDRGWWRNIVHFVEKHNSEGLFDAATHHIMSHLEFGGCLMDINGLKTRYENIRKLEDVDDLKYRGFPHVPPQVRFVQYYTVCHGYPKKPDKQNLNYDTEIPGGKRSASPASSTPKVSAQNHGNLGSPRSPVDIHSEDSIDTYEEESSLQLLAPEPIPEDEPIAAFGTAGQPLESRVEKDWEDSTIGAESYYGKSDADTDSKQTYHNDLPEKSSEKAVDETADLTDAMESLGLNLPAIPELPIKPEPLDLEQYTEKDARKRAEKEMKKAEKYYAKLVKDRDKIIKDRQKIIDKRKKKLAQEAEKREKEERKRRKKEEAMIAASSSSTSEEQASQNSRPFSSQESRTDLDSRIASPIPNPSEQSRGKAKPPKQPKERKFCNLPDKVNGQVDPKWVKIFMKDTDQVGAHTGLFFRGEHYDRLVGDVGETIVKWVQDDMTKRAILEMEESALSSSLD
ncbi:hypothetical protein K449DRAFT_73255 [Hypoxylon sp. EC38]|nr:hypothetical protein K449DRAFT_73255 [Hypoxylon sp. EC38]